MNLTEPQAGSDVGALTTRAAPAGDGTYRITGTKIFISFGEHDMADNIIHLVLARTPDAKPGTKGISCFIVPKFLVNDDGSLGERNDVTCVSIEHKMGIKASPTCVLSYGEQGEGAIGYLIGDEHDGMRYMFTMMNNARLSVGLEGLALAERAYQDAVEYAQERQQGRALDGEPGQQAFIVEHPDVRRMLLTMKALIEAMRGLMYLNAEALDRSRHDTDDDVRERAAELADLLTPLSKAWGTDMGCEVTSLAIQVYGGMGYIEESGVAQHYRDARITPIYEGTNGIQAMDLVGRKLPMRGGGVVTDHLDAMDAVAEELAADGSEHAADLAAIGERLASSTADAREATTWLIENGMANPADALAGATAYLRLLATATGGWVLAREAQRAAEMLGAGEGDAAFLEAKITTARFFADTILPTTAGLIPAVSAGAEQLYAIEPAQL